MPLKDLITDPGTRQLSHTKIWANVAYAASTLTFVWQAVKGTITADIWLVYLGVVGGAATASKFLSLRYTGGGAASPPLSPPLQGEADEGLRGG